MMGKTEVWNGSTQINIVPPLQLFTYVQVYKEEDEMLLSLCLVNNISDDRWLPLDYHNFN